MGYTGGRIALVVVGLVVLLFGWVSAISAEYASGSNSTMESHGGTAVVYADTPTRSARLDDPDKTETPAAARVSVVGVTGLEPVTPAL
jgi:hypothetical protein